MPATTYMVVDPRRDHVLTGMEGHVEHNPQRAIRTDRYLHFGG